MRTIRILNIWKKRISHNYQIAQVLGTRYRKSGYDAKDTRHTGEIKRVLEDYQPDIIVAYAYTGTIAQETIATFAPHCRHLVLLTLPFYDESDPVIVPDGMAISAIERCGLVRIGHHVIAIAQDLSAQNGNGNKTG